jgi:hypothetical protein
MNRMPGFNAEASFYKMNERYQETVAYRPIECVNQVVPALPPSWSCYCDLPNRSCDCLLHVGSCAFWSTCFGSGWCSSNYACAGDLF